MNRPDPIVHFNKPGNALSLEMGWCNFNDDLSSLSGIGSYSPDTSMQIFANIYTLTLPLSDIYIKMYTDWKNAINAFVTWYYKFTTQYNSALLRAGFAIDYFAGQFTITFANGLATNPDVNSAMTVMCNEVINYVKSLGYNIGTYPAIPQPGTTLVPVDLTNIVSTPTYDTQGNLILPQSPNPSYTPVIIMGGIALAVLLFKKN